MTDSWQFHLHPQLKRAIAELGYEHPTPIQAEAIPKLLAGSDVIGQAQTGTGKTAAFALPMLHSLQPEARYVQALVLTPTRELALQVADAISTYGRYRGIRVLPVYGGQPYGPQVRQLQQGVHVVVGTPGRLLDLIRRHILDLHRVHFLVLDEADEMLSMGFLEEVQAILEEVPEKRQTALFSATVSAAIRRLADTYMHNPEAVTIQHPQRTVAAIEQRYYLVDQRDKVAALLRIFAVENVETALIFARTRAGTTALANELTTKGIPAEALNGDLSQSARERILARFQQRRNRVLVATDIAARGLDIDHISHVINFDLPQHPEAYVHRIGRTGRAGKTGVAITLVTPRERWQWRKVESYIRASIPQATIPTEAEIQQQRDARLVERLLVWLKRGRYRHEKDLVEALIAEGYAPEDIAAAAMKMLQRENTPPVEPVRTVSFHRNGNRFPERRGGRHEGYKKHPKRRGQERGMVRLHLNAGRTHGILPGDVVGALAGHTDIPGSVIGAIRIQDNHTLVDIPEQFVEQVLAQNGQYQIRRRVVHLTRT